MGCYDRNYGEVEFEDGIVVLRTTFPNKQQGFQGIATRLIPVAWGKRKYLVPENDVVGFCNEVNSRREPRSGLRGSSYLLRVGDEKILVQGMPELPRKYRQCLLKSPVTARVVAIGESRIRPSICEWNFKDTDVEIDKGHDDGVFVGMELYVVAPDDLVESITVTEVAKDKATGVLTNSDENAAGPEVGWKLSTLPRWRDDG